MAAGTGYVDASNSDVVVGFENVIGSSGNDTIKGNNSNNILIGGKGNDTFMSRGGVNTIYGGTIDNSLVSGEINTISYEDETRNIIVDMSQNKSGINDSGIISNIDNATLHGVQNAIGGNGDDIFKTNTSVSNSFDGIAGSDTVDYSHLTNSSKQYSCYIEWKHFSNC